MFRISVIRFLFGFDARLLLLYGRLLLLQCVPVSAAVLKDILKFRQWQSLFVHRLLPPVLHHIPQLPVLGNLTASGTGFKPKSSGFAPLVPQACAELNGCPGWVVDWESREERWKVRRAQGVQRTFEGCGVF